MSDDVIDDFGAGPDGLARGLGVVGIDGNDGPGALFENRPKRWQNAPLLFGWGDGNGTRSRRFTAQIEDVSAAVEHMERVREAGIGIEKLPAIGEGVWRYV